ncbi:hypothetical protein HMPREF9370_0422 [Neisseria wadsworthii 9715]|uniref:Uncharacterized protein n=1 Tax=Neisseria wadsworthii 9715 TaxID=1030841 RepID=G4CMW3_9NEIS|nr:hypothetical protein HMPREF9370_0422 [Neisseria wadsworthii 9715]
MGKPICLSESFQTGIFFTENGTCFLVYCHHVEKIKFYTNMRDNYGN